MSRKRARVLPWASRTASKESTHSAVSSGSMSGSWWLNPSKITPPIVAPSERLSRDGAVWGGPSRGRKVRIGRHGEIPCSPGGRGPGHAGPVPAGAKRRTLVYTDGACQGNPGPGGWAWAVPDGPYRSGAAAHSTNQRMEIQAALDAVMTLEGPLEVVSDSTYVVNCFRDRWWEGWLTRGWVNTAKKPVANRDLWEPLIDAYRADPQRIRFGGSRGTAATR